MRFGRIHGRVPAPAAPTPGQLAIDLLFNVQDLAQYATQSELEHIIWRGTRIIDDLVFKASADGARQRLRLAGPDAA